MIKIVNAEQMRAADRHAIEVLKIPSIRLMENAATQVTRILMEQLAEPKRVAVVCGKGNNGGDGLAVARLLKEEGWHPLVLLLGAFASLKNDPAENWRRAIGAGVPCFENVTTVDLKTHLRDVDLIVDAIFGTGLSKPLGEDVAKIVKAMNESKKQIWSVDVPSGLSSDTGELIGPAVRATATVALAGLKHCHLFPPASGSCGEIFVVDIGIPVTDGQNLVRAGDVVKMLPHHEPDSHKGTFGHAVILGGSKGKSGAPYMAAKAALRSGAGLVTVVSPPNVHPLVAGYGPEVMAESAGGHPDFFSREAVDSILTISQQKSAVALGPGIGTQRDTEVFAQTVIPAIDAPLVIDADGLNLLAKDKSILLKRKPGSTVLTPHPGEMARLMSLETARVQKERLKLAAELAQELRCIVALKGFRTVIADAEGNLWINPSGGQALASAGTGDVLTGIITGFAAQKMPLLHATIAGVFCHGLVGSVFEKKYPQQALNAIDILDYWNDVIHRIRTEKNLESEYFRIHFAF